MIAAVRGEGEGGVPGLAAAAPRRTFPEGMPTFFLCGDVMTGRGVDQILRHPSEPWLAEGFVRDARDYVELAEARNGPIPRGVSDEYVWGDALVELDRAAPDARVVNLETSVTTSEDAWPKGINYRMHPANVGCLTAARLDVCVLANNHVLDYGVRGLIETLEVLRRAGLRVAGAGRDRAEARRPARVPLPGGSELLVFGVGSPSAGVPLAWAAGPRTPGVEVVPALTDAAADALADRVARARRAGDLAIVSIHWGSNWGYEVPPEQIRFAHRLIDGGVDLVHGHSSHHPRPIEVYRRRLVLYGCGDFLSDYEGITGYEEYRGDLGLMYLASIDRESGRLDELQMAPMQVRSFRLRHASRDDAAWLCDVLDRESRRFGVKVELRLDHALLHASVTRGAVEPRPCARP